MTLKNKVLGFLNKEKKAFKQDDKTAYLFAAPYLILFTIFIILPTIYAIYLSFTSFNMVGAPKWNNFQNYIFLLTSDEEFMKYILPNTIKFSVICGTNVLYAGSKSAGTIVKPTSSSKIPTILSKLS